VVFNHYYLTNKQRERKKEMRKKVYRIKMLNPQCVLASWNGGLGVQSSYIRQPKDQMSDLESYASAQVTCSMESFKSR
jgi:hypothetical protein